MVVVMKVSEVSFRSSNLRKVWYRTITMVALIKDKMQNTAIRVRLFFVSEVNMVWALRSKNCFTHFYTSLKKSINDTRVDENEDTNLKTTVKVP